MNQEHHPNRHQKKEKMKITWIKDVVGQTTMSLLNRNKKNVGHHSMSVTTCTHLSEDHHKNCKYPFFVRILNVPQIIHALIKKKIKSKDFVLLFLLTMRSGYNQ